MSHTLLVRGARQVLTLRNGAVPRRGAELSELSIIDNGALLVKDGKIAAVGPASRIENLSIARKAEELDARGGVVLPGFVDCHTHLLYGSPRLEDFALRLAGKGYEEIARAGGGILSTVKRLRAMSPQRLKAQAQRELWRMAECGTTTVEAKTGYALDSEGEQRCLRILQSLDGDPLEVSPTFLGAHAVPPEFDGQPDAWINHLVTEVLPAIAARKLARCVDVYCDRNAFQLAQARRYLEAARRLGFAVTMHAGQFQDIGGVALALEMGARSVDHLEHISRNSISLLAGARTAAVLLPGSVLFLGSSRYAPARALIDAGAAVALATDYNPGTSPVWNMQMVVALACTQMRMTPAEAICAATVNGAYVLGIEQRVGTLEAGKQADFVVMDAADYREIGYYFGANLAVTTVKQGRILKPPVEGRNHGETAG
ncbi:MAG: imidazolonepropionase [Bryobacteraceae bacterium]|jgi:imidazolonepropionase